MLEIVTGLPPSEIPNGPAASFTRFILPFAYSPVTWKQEQINTQNSDVKNQFAYRPIKEIPNRLFRERYFTEETAEVLFQRAQWFRLEPAEKKEWSASFEFPSALKPDDDSCRRRQVAFTQPVIVLFEWPQAKIDSSPHMMCTGFLIQEMYFPDKIPDDENCAFHGNKSERELQDNKVTLDDLLQLNELFRYWQKPFEGHEDSSEGAYRRTLDKFPIFFGSNKNIGDQYDEIKLYLERWSDLLEYPLYSKDSPTPLRLFSQKWSDTARTVVKEGRRAEKNGADATDLRSGLGHWIVYADNRTFVWSCAVMKEGGNSLRELFSKPNAPSWKFGHWIKFLNIDPPGKDWRSSDVSTKFEQQWAKERTYKRWDEIGTFHGFNNHSGVTISPYLTFKNAPDIAKNVAEMYFDVVLLLLYLRVTLFRFSVELNRITADTMDKNNEDREGWYEQFNKLRRKFLNFTNLYQFPLLSNQQQGIEIYSLARQCMDVDELFKEIKDEIYSSHEYQMMEQEQRQTTQAERLTVVATVGLVAGLAFSFLGMNILVDAEGNNWASHKAPHLLVLLGTLIFFWSLTKMVVFYSKGLARFFESIAKCGERECEKICRILKGEEK